MAEHMVRLSGLGLIPNIIKTVNGVEKKFLDQEQLKAVYAKYGPPGIDPKTDRLMEVESEPKRKQSKKRVS